jgi:acetyl esterase
MPLDEEVRLALTAFRPSGAPPMESIPVATLRAGFTAGAAKVAAARAAGQMPPARHVDRVEDRSIVGPGGSLQVRLYRPATVSSAPLAPLLVFLHGGGHVLCNLDTHDDLCRDLSAELDAVVVSVDYRLAPEHPFPAAINDAVAAVHWAVAQATTMGADAARLCLVGDSAGANLAIAAALQMLEQSGPRPALLALIYPVTDMRADSGSRYRSRAEMGNGDYGLGQHQIAYLCSLYLPDATLGESPLATPLLSHRLHELPTTLLSTAEYDALRDEGQAFGDALAAAGVLVDQRCYDGLPHAFVQLVGASAAARTAWQNILTRFRARLQALSA